MKAFHRDFSGSLICRIVTTVVLATLCAPASKTQETRVKVAVIGLSNPSTLRKSNIGNALVDILDSEISEAGKYTLLERAELDESKKELNLGESDLADAKTFAQKGGLSGADFLLLGKVSEYTYHENVSQKQQFILGRGLVNVLSYDHVGDVRVDIRLVDVRTGENVRSVSGRGTADIAGSVTFQQEWETFVSTEGQATLANLRTLLTDASTAAIRDAVRKLNDMDADLLDFRSKQSVSTVLSSIGDGKILADIGDGKYVIGVPSTTSLKVGDHFRVISEVPIKNARGVVVYSEKRDAGTIEIVDISQKDRAMARLVSPPETAGLAPKENDAITFDENYAKTLRGVAVPSGSGTSAEPSASKGNAVAIKQYIDKGDRFMQQQEFSEALAQYRSGLQLAPSNADLLSRKSMAEAGVNDFTDAEEDAEKVIAAGGSVRFPVVHNHMMGFCEGDLVLERSKVTFLPRAGDHGFTVTSGSQISAEESVFRGTNLPELVVNWRGQDGKGHRYYLVVTTYLTRKGHASTIPNSFDATGDAGDRTVSTDRMILSLLKVSLP